MSLEIKINSTHQEFLSFKYSSHPRAHFSPNDFYTEMLTFLKDNMRENRLFLVIIRSLKIPPHWCTCYLGLLQEWYLTCIYSFTQHMFTVYLLHCVPTTQSSNLLLTKLQGIILSASKKKSFTDQCFIGGTRTNGGSIQTG